MSKADFSALKPGPITASLVVDELGQSVGSSGNSSGIGNQTDFDFLMWLRSRSEIVLTSGKTAEAEDYRLPSKAKLAILTSTRRNYPRLDGKLDQVKFLGAMSFAEAVSCLVDAGYSKIQTEFGETGFRDLAQQDFDCFVSSKFETGIEALAQRLQLDQLERFEFSDLVIARVTGRGKAN